MRGFQRKMLGFCFNKGRIQECCFLVDPVVFFFFRPPHDQPPIDTLISLYLIYLFALFVMVLKRGEG